VKIGTKHPNKAFTFGSLIFSAFVWCWHVFGCNKLYNIHKFQKIYPNYIYHTIATNCVCDSLTMLHYCILESSHIIVMQYIHVFTMLCVSWPAYVVCVDSVFNASVLIEFSLFKDINDVPMRLKKIHRN